MKLLIIEFVMFSLSVFSMFGMHNHNSDEGKTRIVTDSQLIMGSLPTDRSMDALTIEAFVVNNSIVEINLQNLGLCETYIVDESNRIIDYATINAEIPSTIYLSTNGPGSYYLVIISDFYYTEGCFSIN